jgi:C-terminal peptidase prc
MTAFLRKLLVVGVAILWLGGAAHAAEHQPFVVIVGISEYKDQAIKPRPQAENDAKAFFDFLTDPKCVQADAAHIKLLLGKPDDKRTSEAATKANITKALSWACSTAKDDDVIILFWAGQGAPAGTRTCYFAADSTLKDRVKDAIGAGDIEAELDKLKNTKVCALLDVNFRGYEAGNEKVSETGLERRLSEFDGIKEDSEGPPRPIALLSGSDGMKPSVELEKNGLFTTLLLEAFRGKADKDGDEADGTITAEELFTFVQPELPKRALRLAKQEHRTILWTRTVGLPVAKNPDVAEQVSNRLAKFDELAKKDNLKEEIVKEGRTFLGRMPKLESQRELRKKYQLLADGKLSSEELLKQRDEVLQGLKLSRTDAESFATKVLRVAETARESYVKPVTLQDLTSAAIKGLYRTVNEKLPKEIAERLEKIKSLDEDGLKTLLADARQHLGRRDDLKGSKATDLALDMMLHSLDRYSTFIDEETKRQAEIAIKAEFIGIGVQIQRDVARDCVRITTPLRGSPAYKAQLKGGDLIIKITNTVDKEGKALPEPRTVPTAGMNVNDVVRTILGKDKTPVTLLIEREEKDGPVQKEFTITRGRVQAETVFGVKRNDDDSWDFYLDAENKIAYVRLSQFARNTEAGLIQAVKDLQKKGLNGLILDLRFNPGGYLDSAVDISDLFVDDGKIVEIRPREGKPKVFRGESRNSLLNFPLVVLINGESASASEIVSACIQDHERGIVMGERSFGKGSVQNIMPSNTGDGGEIKITTATYWRPSGKNINRFPNSSPTDDWGVVPHADYTLALTPAERDELHEYLTKRSYIPRRDAPKKEEPSKLVDRQLDMAVQFLQKQVTAKASSKKAG